MARILLVEPYRVGSHAAWADGWLAHSRHEIVSIGHEGSHWRWRMRGSAVSLRRDLAARDDLDRIDVVVASNMIDLAGFLGITRRVFGSTPIVQYFHENQLSYPRRPGEALDAGLAWMQWRGAVAADELWFNSGFHRDAFVAGLDDLLPTAPDHDHRPERATLEHRLRVVPPGIWFEACRPPAERGASARPLILSNQRWHHDKDVASVVRAVRRLVARGVDVDLAVVGDPSGGEADRIEPLLDALGERVVARGWLPRPAYLELLHRADLVVSAARGENFGIGVAEAIAAGAWPVLPNALSYPELVPESFHDRCLYDAGGLGRRLEATVAALMAGERPSDGLAVAMSAYAWPNVAAVLDDHIDALTAV